jgi:ribosomal protein L29
MTSSTDLKKKSPAELTSFVAEKREELRQIRFAIAGSKGRDVKKMHEAKKDIARALTIQNAIRNVA